MKLGIIAGETSGDLLGAALIHALRKIHPHLTVEGIAGPAMIAAGCNALFDSERLSVMGLIEPLFHLPELLKIRRNITNHFLQQRPDVFIGIDSPDFNLGIELQLKKAGIKTIHYVSPTVWAWRKNRIHKIAKATDKVLTLFPFEKNFYDQHGVSSVFVGHPLADKIPVESDQLAARKKIGLEQGAIYIALLPGSRRTEIQHLGEIFIKTAKLCWEKNKKIRFITSAVNEKREKEFKLQLQKVAPELPLHFFTHCSQEVMAAADTVLVCSGTATLEAMLIKRPMVIVFKTGFLSYQIAKWLVDVNFIGLPNLLANEKLVPEFIQNEAQPETLAQSLLDLLNVEKQELLKKRFTELHHELKKDASQAAANAVMDLC